MGGIVGIIFLIFILVRAIGGSIRDTYHNKYLKSSAKQKGYSTWMDTNGVNRDIITDHKTPYVYDNKIGLHREDIDTGHIYTDEINQVLTRFHKAKNEPHEGTVWQSQIARKMVYIDYNTEAIYQMVCVSPKWKDGNIIKDFCYFYTDFWTNTEVIRKSDQQLEKEKTMKPSRIYTLDELRAYPWGNLVRDENGKWHTTNDMTYAY